MVQSNQAYGDPDHDDQYYEHAGPDDDGEQYDENTYYNNEDQDPQKSREEVQENHGTSSHEQPNDHHWDSQHPVGAHDMREEGYQEEDSYNYPPKAEGQQHEGAYYWEEYYEWEETYHEDRSAQSHAAEAVAHQTATSSDAQLGSFATQNQQQISTQNQASARNVAAGRRAAGARSAVREASSSSVRAAKAVGTLAVSITKAVARRASTSRRRPPGVATPGVPPGAVIGYQPRTQPPSVSAQSLGQVPSVAGRNPGTPGMPHSNLQPQPNSSMTAGQASAAIRSATQSNSPATASHQNSHGASTATPQHRGPPPSVETTPIANRNPSPDPASLPARMPPPIPPKVPITNSSRAPGSAMTTPYPP